MLPMSHWLEEAGKIMSINPQKYRAYHAAVLMHTHRRGLLEGLQWAASQVVPDGNPESALSKIAQRIKAELGHPPL